METLLISIDYRDPAWIAIAFAFGLVVKQIQLPPMVGFLIAGFILNALGAENDRFLQAAADLGVTLLLFTIGLKLKLGTLLRPEIWATTSLHMATTVAILFGAFLVLGAVGFLMFDGLDLTTLLLLAFALSFSSTVFAVKTLEDRGAAASRYGLAAIGVLVMQDIIAVAFLAASSGKLPSVWAIGLLALIPAKYLLGRVMALSGHGELLTIFGFAMALSGAAVFELVGLKGDLGALVFGAMLAGHARASELARTLMGFKEVFLVCFFLTIGLTGLPTVETLLVALALLLFLPMKTVLFFWLFTRFRLRARAAALGALTLGNYSEFGLIVVAVAVGTGWLDAEWMTVVALTVSASFVVAAPVNVPADSLYSRFRKRLRRFESAKRLPGDEDLALTGARVVVFGMGRVGLAAFDEIRTEFGDRIIGVDFDESTVEENVAEGRNVIIGDATNPEFWSRLRSGQDEIELILLSMPHHNANARAARLLRSRGYTGPIVATAKYPDEDHSLTDSGVTTVFNLYAEAGSGAAMRMRQLIEDKRAEAS